MDSKTIDILIVDDSAVSRQLLKFIIDKEPALQIVGMAASGEEAINMLEKIHPHIILMDIVMPNMDGFETTRHIMENKPIPIIIISGVYNPNEVYRCYQAISAGALAIMEKPTGPQDPAYAQQAFAIIQSIKSLAFVKVKQLTPPKISTTNLKKEESAPHVTSKQVPDIIAIGSSVGGPQALQTILANLPPNIPTPILIVQHISKGFIQGFAEWLQSYTRLQVSVAKDREIAIPGHVYIAPDGYQMAIQPGRIIQITDDPIEHGSKPSISYLFRSIAKFYGVRAVGIILSGSGQDGVDELALIHDKGGITIVQNEETSIMFDKANKAIQRKAVTHVLPIQQIAPSLINLCKISPSFR